MDFSKSRKNRLPNPPSEVPDPNPADAQRMQFQETNENGGLTPMSTLEKHFMSITISSSSKKKILGERNDAVSSNSSESDSKRSSSAEPVIGSQRIRWSGDRNGTGSESPYDPVSNYTSPRPEFLRYNPNRRREILRRIEGELRTEDGVPESSSESLDSFQASFDDREVQESNSNHIGCSPDDEIEEEEEEVEEEPRCSSTVLKSFLLLGVFLLMTCYISLMNSSSIPVLKEPWALNSSYAESWALNSSYAESWALNSSYAKFQDWIFHMVSDPNIITGEEGICYKWVVSVDLVTMERHSEHIGSHSHVLEADVTDEPDALERLKEKEVNDEIQLAVKTEEDEILSVNGSFADENSKEYISSVDLLEKEQQNNADGDDGEEEGTETDSVAEEDLLSYTKQGLEWLKEKEVKDEIQLAVKTEEDEILSANGSLADENSKECISSVDSIEMEQQSNADGDDGEEEGTETDSVAEEDLLSYTKQGSQDQLSSQGSSDESVTMSEGDTRVPETSAADFVSIMQSENRNNEEETDFLSTIEMNLVPEQGLTSLSKDIEQVLLLLLPLSVSVLLVARWKHNKSSPALLHPFEPAGQDNILTISEKEEVEGKNNVSSKSNLQPPSSSHDEQKGSSGTQPQAQELLREQRSLEITNRRGNINARSSTSHSKRDEHEEFTGIRPPTVELLGEFSVVKTCFSGTGSEQKLYKKKDQDLQQVVTQHHRRRPERKNASPSADYVNLYQSSQSLVPAMSTSNGSFSTPEKLPTKEDVGDEEAGKSIKTTTPLRRSTRLRNRVTSP